MGEHNKAIMISMAGSFVKTKPCNLLMLSIILTIILVLVLVNNTNCCRVALFIVIPVSN